MTDRALLTEDTFHSGMKELHKRHDRTDTRIDTLDGHVREVDEKANTAQLSVADLAGEVKANAVLLCGATDCAGRTTLAGPLPRRFNGRKRDATMVGLGGGGLVALYQIVQAVLQAVGRSGSP
ncbi:MAG: hypothetical protein QGI10_00090 [Vicinamibacterales bacterium]|nr:hypothetical protein [Vicinamibacterales bacterium]MDP7477646.1 hypothetical protein [Vicinamibacterales bacterium]